MSVVVPGIGRDVTIRMQEVAFQPRQQTTEYPYPYFPYGANNGGGARATATKETVSPARALAVSDSVASAHAPVSTVRPLAAVLSAIESAGSPGMSEESRVDKLCRKLQRSFQEKNMMLSEIQYLKQQLKEVTQSASSTIEAEREAMDQLVESNVRTGVLACVWCIKTQAVKMLAMAFHRWKVYEPDEKVEDGEEAFWRLLKDSVRSKLNKAAPSSSSSGAGTGAGGAGGAGGSPNTQLLRFMHAASKAAGLGEGSMGSFLASLAAGGGGGGAGAGPHGGPGGPNGALYGGFRPRFMAQGTKSSQAKAKGATQPHPQPAFHPTASVSASAASGLSAGSAFGDTTGAWGGGPRPRHPFGYYNNNPSPKGSPSGRSRSPPYGRYGAPAGAAPPGPQRSPESQVYTALLALAAEKVRVGSLTM